MIAADGIALLEKGAALKRRIRMAIAVCLGAAVLLAASYCAGKSRGAADVRTHVADSIRKVQKDTIRVVEQRIVRDTVILHAAAAKADTARTTFHVAEAAVEGVADTSATLPTSLVMPALHTCEQAITADTVAYVAVVAELLDMTEDRNVWKARAQNDEANTPKVPYFGFKSGVLAGAAVVIALLHFAR